MNDIVFLVERTPVLLGFGAGARNEDVGRAREGPTRPELFLLRFSSSHSRLHDPLQQRWDRTLYGKMLRLAMRSNV